MQAVARLEDIPENGTLPLAAGGENLLLVRSDFGVFAIENRCSHALQQLHGGKVRKVHIFCPEHGVRFDMRDGCPAGKLTEKPIKAWASEVVDGEVHVDLDRRVDKGAAGA